MLRFAVKKRYQCKVPVSLPSCARADLVCSSSHEDLVLAGRKLNDCRVINPLSDPEVMFLLAEMYMAEAVVG